MQKLKDLIKLSNLCNFQLYTSNIEGNIKHQKLRNCCVAKTLMSHTFSVTFRVFRRDWISPKPFGVLGSNFQRYNWNCYGLSTFRVFALLASSDSDMHMLIRWKSVNKDSPINHCNFIKCLRSISHVFSVYYCLAFKVIFSFCCFAHTTDRHLRDLHALITFFSTL